MSRLNRADPWISESADPPIGYKELRGQMTINVGIDKVEFSRSRGFPAKNGTTRSWTAGPIVAALFPLIGT